MTKKRHAILTNNRNYLVENIQPNDELLASLLSLNCITEEQIHFIQRHRSTRDKNYELLYIMESFDETKFSSFVNCLRRTNQRTVAKIIENGGGLTFKLYLKTLFVSHLYSIGLAVSLSHLLAPDETARPFSYRRCRLTLRPLRAHICGISFIPFFCSLVIQIHFPRSRHITYPYFYQNFKVKFSRSTPRPQFSSLDPRLPSFQTSMMPLCRKVGT